MSATADETSLADTLLDAGEGEVLPLWLITDTALPAWLASQPAATGAWLRAHGFQGEKGRVVHIPAPDGTLAGVVAGLGANAEPDPWCGAALAALLPVNRYVLRTLLRNDAATQFVLSWLLGGYSFARYRSGTPARRARLVAPSAADIPYARSAAGALNWARDLINAPPNDFGPQELADAALTLVQRHGGTSRIVMDEALRTGYPLIAAVGRGSPRAPRLIDCRWGAEHVPRVTLVGKGVCFDTGGLDIKPSAGMSLMKKDMGGAACVLALARLLLEMRAPIQLRVLIPAVENSVDGEAFRPSDVWLSRKGLSVEIGNTDAEGRLVLADALADADSDNPDLLVDLATLTGAARVALGPELPAAFSNSEELLGQLYRCAMEEGDPLWPMPLWAGYDDHFSSSVADIGNVAAGGFGGAIIAALFLKRFVTACPQWLHVDLYAWNPRDRPGRPLGAEAHGVRALYSLIRRRYG
ncbi:MAG: leucyl aminopeptidase family protein [Steroidobacteraceae bacterium]